MIENRECYGYIYRVMNKKSGKLYIGQTIKKGYKFHRYLGSGQAIVALVKREGKENFSKVILDYAFSERELNYLEKLYIEMFSTSFPEIGYNLTLGGHNGIPNEETRKKISMGNKGKKLSEETRKKISESESGKNHYNWGKHPSEETRKKQSISHLGHSPSNKGIPHSQNTKNKIKEKRSHQIMTNRKKVINLDTKEIFASMKEACNKYDIMPSELTSHCQRKENIRYVKKFRWAYYSDSINIEEEIKSSFFIQRNKGCNHPKSRIVLNIETGRIYNTVTEAALSCGKHHSGIIDSCTNPIYTCGGFHWKYLDK
jgi:group I intron endonuclease